MPDPIPFPGSDHVHNTEEHKLAASLANALADVVNKFMDDNPNQPTEILLDGFFNFDRMVMIQIMASLATVNDAADFVVICAKASSANINYLHDEMKKRHHRINPRNN